MIRKTRIKIIVVTMAILVAVFIAIGAVTFSTMVGRPQRYPFEDRPGGMSAPSGPEFDDAIKIVESQLAKQWLLMYSAFAGLGLAGLFIITYYLSGWIVKPVKETMEKQKQFVSDASHELKTPISIISANADALTANGVDNKWLQNIKTQAGRMGILTHDLLVLTRLDEGSEQKAERLDVSGIVSAAVLPFESVAFEAGKTLETDIAQNLYCAAGREDLTKAVNILTDNAIKYSGDGGLIKLKLYAHNAKPVLEVYNTGAGIPEKEKEKIFDRFYRSDYSRTRESGGNGLGLSILKSIADKNGWKLAVNSDGKSYTAFIIQF